MRRSSHKVKVIESPFPVSEEIISDIPRSTLLLFMNLDIGKVYNQQLVIEKSDILPIRAPRRGLVRFKMLPLGLSSAVALFQTQTEELLEKRMSKLQLG